MASWHNDLKLHPINPCGSLYINAYWLFDGQYNCDHGSGLGASSALGRNSGRRSVKLPSYISELFWELGSLLFFSVQTLFLVSTKGKNEVSLILHPFLLYLALDSFLAYPSNVVFVLTVWWFGCCHQLLFPQPCHHHQWPRLSYYQTSWRRVRKTWRFRME